MKLNLCFHFRGICSSDEAVQRRLDLRKLCDGYFDLYKKQSKSKTLQVAQKDEFFGLRDFYRLDLFNIESYLLDKGRGWKQSR